jgi:hypothetical protein
MPEREAPKTYLVECYWPGVSEHQLAAATRQAQAAAAQVRQQGRKLRFLGSLLVPAEETVFCLFEGSESDVRAVSAQAGVPAERILESLRVGAGEQAEAEESRSESPGAFDPAGRSTFD